MNINVTIAHKELMRSFIFHSASGFVIGLGVNNLARSYSETGAIWINMAVGLLYIALLSIAFREEETVLKSSSPY